MLGEPGLSEPHLSTLTGAFVINALGEGGAQRSALVTAGAWPARSGRCIVISARSGPYADDLPQHVPSVVLDTGWPRPVGVARFLAGLRRTNQVHTVRTLFTNGFGLNRSVMIVKICRLLSARVVVIERSTFSAVLVERFRSGVARWAVRSLTRFLYRRADAVVGVSEGVSQDLERTLRLPRGSVKTIHNPVDVDHIRAAIEEPPARALADAFLSLPRPVTLNIGRLVPQKAQADLLGAFAALPERQRGSLVILGEGPLRADLTTQAARLGIADALWMPGFVANPWWFTARADVFCLSSRHEGHPRALLEALACGTPVVSTDCPHGPRETLEGVDAARLVPVNDIDALAEALAELLDERPTVDVDLTRYRPEHIAQQYADLARSDQPRLRDSRSVR